MNCDNYANTYWLPAASTEVLTPLIIIKKFTAETGTLNAMLKKYNCFLIFFPVNPLIFYTYFD